MYLGISTERNFILSGTELDQLHIFPKFPKNFKSANGIDTVTVLIWMATFYKINPTFDGQDNS